MTEHLGREDKTISQRTVEKYSRNIRIKKTYIAAA